MDTFCHTCLRGDNIDAYRDQIRNWDGDRDVALSSEWQELPAESEGPKEGTEPPPQPSV